MQKHIVSAALAALGALGAAPISAGSGELARALDAVDARGIEADVRFLASDELRGRDTPSEGLVLAARYLRARLMRLGFEPGGEDGGYFDPYDLERERLDLERSRVVVTGADGVEHAFAFGEQYVFSPREVADLDAAGPAVFVGDGARATVAGLDLAGAWAVAIDSELSWRERREAARAAGAIGLAIVADPLADAEPFTRRHRGWVWQARAGSIALADGPAGAAPFPQVYLDAEPARLLLTAAPAVGARLDARIADVRRCAEGASRVTVENVCGFWPGSDPERAREVVVVSAHYDHVGVQNGEIHNGADDNASGSTGLLAVAEALAAHGPLERSVLLLWVSGEEKGLLGSQAWTLDPTLPEGYRAVANVNIDMIGRNAPDSLLITPTEKLPQHNDLVKIAAEHAPLEGFPTLGDCDAYWSRSDQASFSENLQIPVMFLFSDVHEDYHRPGDDAEKIDCDKVRRVSRLVVRILVALEDREI